MNPSSIIRARAVNLPSRAELRTFGAELRGPHRTSASRAVVEGLFVALTLRFRGVRPLLAGLSTRATAPDPGRARAVSDAVDAGMALAPMAPTCLRRSITLLRELDRLGIDGDLHLGVRSVDGRVEAHAWIQVGDEVVNDAVEITSTYDELAGGHPDDLRALLR